MDRSLDEDKQLQNDLEVTAAVEAAPEENRGQAAVLANLHTLGRGDSSLLAQRLKDFPELRDQILEWAMAHLGNDTVNRALAELDGGDAKEVAQATTDDTFVQEQMEVMAEEKSDEEFVAFQMGVMSEEKAQADDNSFVEQQLEEMTKQKSDEEFVAFQMGEMAKQAEDDQFVKDQLQQMEQQKSDEEFVAGQMAVMEQQADDNTFVEGQIEEMAKQQSDEEFVAYEIAKMEADQQERGQSEPAEEAKDVETIAPEQQQMVEQVAAIPEQAPELIGTALAENPELREPLIEQVAAEQGTEVVAEAVEIETEEKQAEVAQEPEAPQAEQEIAAEPVIEEEAKGQESTEEAWVSGARRYNERHAELVAMFNEATDNRYAGPDGSVSPEVIVAWQQANNIAVDGRIGPETVAAAKDGARKIPLAEAIQAPVVEEQVEEQAEE